MLPSCWVSLLMPLISIIFTFQFYFLMFFSLLKCCHHVGYHCWCFYPEISYDTQVMFDINSGEFKISISSDSFREFKINADTCWFFARFCCVIVSTSWKSVLHLLGTVIILCRRTRFKNLYVPYYDGADGPVDVNLGVRFLMFINLTAPSAKHIWLRLIDPRLHQCIIFLFHLLTLLKLCQ